jgi:uracil-DNA glycosylase family 4
VAADVVRCRLCPRLLEHCAEVARVRRAAYREQEYWGLPVPGFGDPAARVLVIGLAPGAHGANRTGRLFTGDRSGDFLFGSLFRAGLCNQPESSRRGDGLELHGTFVSAVIRCAPPENKPGPEEIRSCRSYLSREVLLLRRIRVMVALGKIAFDGLWEALESLGHPRPRPRPAFGHGVLVAAAGNRPHVLASYHPSQQNTQTGRLTPAMLDRIFAQARSLAGI